MADILQVYYDFKDAYGQAFFDGDECINFIHENDGNYRPEYMNPILSHYGIEVKVLKKLNKKQRASLKEMCGL